MICVYMTKLCFGMKCTVQIFLQLEDYLKEREGEREKGENPLFLAKPSLYTYFLYILKCIRLLPTRH